MGKGSPFSKTETEPAASLRIYALILLILSVIIQRRLGSSFVISDSVY